MTLVLEGKDQLEDIQYKGKPLSKIKHRIYFDESGRCIAQFGDCNTPSTHHQHTINTP